jgi:DNA polymerase-1
VLAHAGELKPERFRAAVAADVERLRVNLKLTTLNLALPPVKPEWRTPQPEELVRLLEGYEMRTTAAEARRRYGVGAAPAAEEVPVPPAATPAPVTPRQGELF